MAAAGHSSSSDSAPLQVIWTPNMGCHIRVSLATGEPEYDTYKKSACWVTCRVLRTVGDDGQVAYPPAGDRVFPRNAPISSLKLKPENIPRHPGQQDVAAYFPHGEMAVTNRIEGQLAFLQHVHLYEEKHRGTHILQTRLLWTYEFLRCCFGCLPREELETRESFSRDR